MSNRCNCPDCSGTFDFRGLAQSLAKHGLIKKGVIDAPMSGKDVYSASEILTNAIDKGLEKRAAIKEHERHCENCQCQEKEEADMTHANLWELVLKLRTGANHAKEIIHECDVFNRLESRILSHSFKNVKDPNHANKDVYDIHLALAVIHELCRYQSGCVALAKHPSCLGKILELPLSIILKLMKIMPHDGFLCLFVGQIEQALIDVFGRCLNGLNKEPSLRSSVVSLLHEQVAMKKGKKGRGRGKRKRKIDILSDHVLEVAVFHEFVVSVTGDVALGYHTDLRESMKNLQALASPNGTGERKKKCWRSTFVMERLVLPPPDD